MKKKTAMALVTALAMGILTACGGTGKLSSPVTSLNSSPIDTSPLTSEPADSTSPESESESESEPEVIVDGNLKSGGENHPIGERTVVDGKMQSWLTGEWKDQAVAERRNMAVMMPNNRRAGYKDSSPILKQFGISRASIIYEAPAATSLTRLMPLYEDYDDLEFISPIRSSRDYYIQEAMAFDSIYVNWGLARPWVEALINSGHIDNISAAVAGQGSAYGPAFERNPNLMPGAATEFTSVLNVQKYTSGVKAKGYATEYRDSFIKAFAFADEGYLATYSSSPDAMKIYPGGKEGAGGYGSAPVFEYNAADRLYYRSQWGEPHICGLTGEQLTVTNVVLKVCDGYHKPEAAEYLGFATGGTGKAYIFTNGKVIEGTWTREGTTDITGPGDASYYNPNPTIYYDSTGKEIVLNRGKTWICCIWDDYAQSVTWE